MDESTLGLLVDGLIIIWFLWRSSPTASRRESLGGEVGRGRGRQGNRGWREKMAEGERRRMREKERKRRRKKKDEGRCRAKRDDDE